MRIDPPFTLAGPDIAIDLPGGYVRFTTARGGDLALGDAPHRAASDGAAPRDAPHAPAPAGATGVSPPPAADALAARIGVPWARWAQDRQVHGAHVRAVATEAALRPLTADHDGQATALRGVACVVRVADCLPIALVAPEAVAMLHGGWRPLAGGVVAAGVWALRALGATEIQAAIGPGAGVCCFEVGEEVHAAFAHLGTGARPGGPADLGADGRPGRSGGLAGPVSTAARPVRVGRHADLKAVARAQLEAAGVTAVHDVDVCTICSEPNDLFSHRRDRGVTGRQVGVTWRS